MLYTVREDLNLCVDLKLTPRQLMFIKMLVKDPSMDEGQWRKASYAMALQFQQEVGGLTDKELDDLIDRKIILDYNSPGDHYYDSYEIEPKFAHKFTLKVYPLVSQLCDEYPYIIKIEGGEFVGRNVTEAEISVEYMRAINKNPEEHSRVLDDLRWAKKNNALAMGLKKFVGTKYWNAIREIRKEREQKKGGTDVRIV